MSCNEKWDVEKYKTEHECDEHWELRKKFLLAHSDRFSEDELVCLAQVFVNVEFLGCRYPKETMKLVAELSQEIAKDFRENRKSKLQRTFVKASDAASSKVKGCPNTPKKHCSATSYNQPMSSQKREAMPSQSEVRQVKQMKYLETLNAPFGNVVLFDHGESDTPQGIIARAATSQGVSIEWKFDEGLSETDQVCKCVAIYNSKKLAEGFGCKNKVAKKEAAIKALEHLQKFYYTIKVKKSLTPTIEGGIANKSTDQALTTSLADDNIGRKMMKLMGWGGGGLGKSSQGITEPITVQQQLSRKGLGLQKPGSMNIHAFKRKCHKILSDWCRGDMKTDLVFNPDFTNEERAVVHQIAKQMGVKSNSHGPKDQRTLIISRKINPLELVKELKELGGFTDKYELINPTIEY